LWRRCVTQLTTDILRFDSPERFFWTLEFLWGKKSEIFYHLLGRPLSDAAISKALVDAPAYWRRALLASV
jgi:hypothetical protein